MHLARPLAAAGALALLAAGAAFDAGAQQIYKIVGPDGRVTFSDQPPVDPNGPKAQPAKVVPFTGDSASASASSGSLPFELRQAASRYPVTLYSAPGCQSCAAGRQYLVSRGVPFTERLIVTREDADALNRLTGTQSVPVVMIGSQQLRGYSDTEWAQFLDAAGYPRTSKLPASYVQPPARPLVAVDQPPAPGTAAPAPAEARSTPAPAPATPAGDNPAGITF
jgi:glutaredoxin